MSSDDTKVNHLKVLNFPKKEVGTEKTVTEKSPVPEVVDILEVWLERAKAGDITSIAIVCVDDEQEIFTESFNSEQDFYAIMHATRVLDQRVALGPIFED